LRDLITTEIAERNNNVANRCETVALIRRVSRSLPLLGRASQVMDAVVAAARHKIRWNAVAAVFSISIVAVAALTLYNSLRQIDVATAIAALRSQSLQQVLIAGGFVASAYLTCWPFGPSAERPFHAELPPWQASRAIRSGTIWAPRS
jgi:hypothetical protein